MALFPSVVLQGFLGFNEAVSDISLTFNNVMSVMFCQLAYTVLDEKGCWRCVHPGLHSACYRYCLHALQLITDRTVYVLSGEASSDITQSGKTSSDC